MVRSGLQSPEPSQKFPGTQPALLTQLVAQAAPWQVKGAHDTLADGWQAPAPLHVRAEVSTVPAQAAGAQSVPAG